MEVQLSDDAKRTLVNWSQLFGVVLWIALLILTFTTRKGTANIAFWSLLISAIVFTFGPDYFFSIRRIWNRHKSSKTQVVEARFPEDSDDEGR